jgi:hypothetical protein
MGKVILETGRVIEVSGYNGEQHLSHLISDLEDEQHTKSYRISIIGVIAKLQQFSVAALDSLKKLTGHTDPLIVEAAKQAIKKIDKKDNSSALYDDRTNSKVCSATQPDIKKEVQKVILTEESFDELCDNAHVYRKCNFCEKLISVTNHDQKYSDQLVGKDKFFCHFCIRNGFFTKLNKNVLILTFRGLFSYYYYCYYIAQKSQPFYYGDITDFVEMQCKTAWQNPLFMYDHESFCWFVDFGKIGTNKIPVEAVLKTVIQVLASMGLYDHVRECSPYKVYKKYKNAIEAFYTKRIRIGGDKIFNPTLMDCDIPKSGGKYISEDILKGFVPSHLENVSYNSRDKKRFN